MRRVAVQSISASYNDLCARRRHLPESVVRTLELLIAAPEVTGVILFGSRAVGDHDDRSDFDIAVSAPTLSRAGLARLRDCIGQSRTLFKISISVLEQMPFQLRDRVISQGVRLYECKKAKR